MKDNSAANLDGIGRSVNYLRISVTPHCNLRCNYCYPKQQIVHPGNHEILSIKEITKLATILATAGIQKVRITGGEPLIRKGVVRLVQDIKAIPGIQEVSLTTNGVLLGRMIDELVTAGLDRVNISLDSLKASRIREISGADVFDEIMTAITTIVEKELVPVKLNVVAMKGVNDDEILDFAELAYRYPLEIRFIEMMPFAQRETEGKVSLLSCDEIQKAIMEKYKMVPTSSTKAHSGPAKVYTIKNGVGKIGFVSPMSERFCEDCNRIRLTADGKLRSCLFSDREVDLKPGFATNQSESWFIEKFHEALINKPETHANVPQQDRPMSAIGG